MPRSRPPSSTYTLLVSILAFSLSGILTGCRSDAPSNPQRSGTQAMADTLREIARRAASNPLAYCHLNRERAAYWKDRTEEARGLGERQAAFNHAYELLNAGESEAAIAAFGRLLERYGGAARYISQELRPALLMQAVSYIRLAEQQNCFGDMAPNACIMPLRGAAIHRMTDGSRHAIPLLEELLSTNPDDLTARWLLNVSYMTLNEYPEGVPAYYLIRGLDVPDVPNLPRFKNVAGPLGVDIDGLSGGVALADFDGDGLTDIFATSYGLRDPVHLFLADGRGGYVDRTEQAGLGGIVSGLNVLHADYDNDGNEDLLVLRGAWLADAGRQPNSLLHNNGDGTFMDVTYAAGLGTARATQTAAFADFNLDGLLDLFIGNESGSPWLAYWTGPPGKDAEQKQSAQPSELYVNLGDGSFREVARDVGIELENFAKGVTWGDVDDDGLPDLYVSILGAPNLLYMNRGGTSISNWHFEEVGAEAGVQNPVFSFPTWFWDYDNDGRQDLYVASYDLRRADVAAGDIAAEYLHRPSLGETDRLYHNDGDGTFTDVTAEMGLERSLFTMGSNFGDVDGDGFLDMYLGTGSPAFSALTPNRLFRNDHGKRFTDQTFERGVGHLQKGHAIGFGDLDRDGDQDIYEVMGGAVEGDHFPNVLYENPGDPSNPAWVVLKLEGTTANRSAIGARIRVTVRDENGARHVFYRSVSTGGSFGASTLEQEIGLGRLGAIHDVTVDWPDAARSRETFTGLTPGHAYRLVQGSGRPTVLDWTPVPFIRTPP